MLQLGGMVTVNATTVGATANYAYCLNPPAMSPPASPDVVYAFTLASAGLFELKVVAANGSSLLPNIDIRPDCSKPSSYCESTGNASGDIAQYLNPGTYYAIISGANCTAGAFTLTATLTSSMCGDSVVEGNEQCDPGPNPPANNGCGAPGAANACMFIPAPAGEDQCPGQAVAIPAGTTILPASMGMSTYGFKDDYIGSCNQGPGGLDRVFQLTPAKSGTMTVSVGYETDGATPTCTVEGMTGPGCWASMLYARTSCGTASTEVAGACAVGVNGLNIVPTTISFPVTANTPYWVFVDGYDNQDYSYGPFNFIVKLQ